LAREEVMWESPVDNVTVKRVVHAKKKTYKRTEKKNALDERRKKGLQPKI